MAFQPPLAEIAFTLDKIAGLDAALANGRLRRSLGRDGARHPGRGRPVCRRGAGADQPRRATASARAARTAACSPHPAGARPIGGSRDAGWGGIAAPEAFGGQGLPVMLGMAVQELWNAGAAAFAVGPMLTAGAIDAIAAHASPALKAALSAAPRLGRVDGDDEPDRAAGRLRPRRHPHARRAGRRRHLPPVRPEDLHHLRRARFHRQHHPPRPRPPRRRARRHARHLAFSGAEAPRQRRRLARRRATTSSVPASSRSSACTARRPAP